MCLAAPRPAGRFAGICRKRPLGSKKGDPWEAAFFCKSLIYKEKFLVAWGGIEPPTRGFSILARKCSSLLTFVARLYVNQQFNFAT
jgi:hypothetical protein